MVEDTNPSPPSTGTMIALGATKTAKPVTVTPAATFRTATFRRMTDIPKTIDLIEEDAVKYP
jgi:hypothetical protein